MNVYRFPSDIDGQLLARLRSGHMEAFDELYRLYASALYTLALRMTGRPEDAEELVQQAFVDLVAKLPSFRGEAPFGAWLRRLFVNQVLMHLRRQGWLSLEADGAALEIASDASPATAADLETLLSRLPTVTRSVLWLYEIEGYGHAEIGQLFGRSESFSKSQLARARAQLRQHTHAEARPCQNHA